MAGPMPTQAFAIDVRHDAYLEEHVEVNPGVPGAPTWDNPVCTVGPTGIVVRLSRLRAAPTTPISNAEREQRQPFDPRGVFTWIDEAGNRTNRYLDINNHAPQAFHLASTPMLPKTPGDGWKRLNHGAPVPSDPGRDGDLVWLEWGLGQGRQARTPPRRRRLAAANSRHDAEQARRGDFHLAEHRDRDQ